MPLPTLSDQIVKTCTFDGHPSTSQHCEATIGPFPDGKFIAYGAQALDAKGQTGVDQWIGFAVGAQKDPDEPIAVYTRGGTISTPSTWCSSPSTIMGRRAARSAILQRLPGI